MLGLDVANQIIFISKNGEEKNLKITFFFFFFSIFQKKKIKLQKFVKKKTLPTVITIPTGFNHIMGSHQNFENP
jgi:hypothetical protein